MVDLPKLDFVGLASVLAGLIFLVTGILIAFNTGRTVPDAVNPSFMAPLGVITAFIGLVLLVSRDE